MASSPSGVSFPFGGHLSVTVVFCASVDTWEELDVLRTTVFSGHDLELLQKSSPSVWRSLIKPRLGLVMRRLSAVQEIILQYFLGLW